jgi:chemotaxis protein methyltransferase CheR
MEELGIAELKRLTEVIKQKFGYDFKEYAMSSFKRRITRVLELKNLCSIEALALQIENNVFTKEDFLHEITVNVTELFRDPSFWRVMKTIIPNMFLNQEKIRIWHAGCSSGEEVYSMLILLKEMNLLDKVEIMASDIDKCILTNANEGKIPIRNMEMNEKNYIRYNPNGELKKYFTYDKDFAYFDKLLLSKVSFCEVNLAEVKSFTKCDLILCRNVMIYFNQNLQNEVIKLFHEMLFTYGYLAIGSKESIIWSKYANNFLVVNKEEKIYKNLKN